LHCTNCLYRGVCKDGNCLGERGSWASLETVVTSLTSIENQSDRYLLANSKNQSPEGFLLHERFEDLWEKRCSKKENFVEIIQGIVKRLRI
jgi:hypothetical protein